MNAPTVSFHLGSDFCSIDIDAKSLSPGQLTRVEQLANEVVMDDRPVSIRFVSLEEARKLGLRKLPEVGRDELRLIDLQDFDLTACGGTHVSRTGEVGCILLRKVEKVKQAVRVGFVCGLRAVATARQDFNALSDAAGLFSAPMWELPQLLRKSQEESRAQRKYAEGLLAELASHEAERLLANALEVGGARLVKAAYADRDASYIKLLAQRLLRNAANLPVTVLLGSTVAPAGLVFAQSAGLAGDMGSLLKELLAAHGGRGGGTKEMAQGGVPDSAHVELVLAEAEARLRSAVE
jgi:alanyl-tRNA synthetase